MAEKEFSWQNYTNMLIKGFKIKKRSMPIFILFFNQFFKNLKLVYKLFYI